MLTDIRARRVPTTWLGVLVSAIALLLLIAGTAFVMVEGPPYLVRHDLEGRSISTQDQLKSINDARVTALQALGGIALLVGAYVAWRRLRINDYELRATQDNNLAENFGRSIDQLGSERLDVRMGGVYGLERIARNSKSERDAVVVTLCTFIRNRCPRTGNADETDTPSLGSRAGDAQVALEILGRLPRSGTQERVRLPRADLRQSRLWKLDLGSALLSHSDLRGARLWGTSLIDADLGAADLRGADLSGAKLGNAWLVGADLRGAILENADLLNSRADAMTEWPDDFDPSARGVRVLSEAEKLAERRNRDLSRGQLPR